MASHSQTPDLRLRRALPPEFVVSARAHIPDERRTKARKAFPAQYAPVYAESRRRISVPREEWDVKCRVGMPEG